MGFTSSIIIALPLQTLICATIGECDPQTLICATIGECDPHTDILVVVMVVILWWRILTRVDVVWVIGFGFLVFSRSLSLSYAVRCTSVCRLCW